MPASSSACCVSLLMSTRQPVSRAASRAFWPSRPMARESWKSGTMTSATPVSSWMRTSLTLAGDSALATKSGWSSLKGTMSIFSPRSSVTTIRTRAPRAPTQAPTGSTLWSFDQDGHLRAVAGLAGAGLDLDDTVADLGHLQLEQALDEAGVRAGDDDLRALGRAADLDDVGLQAGAGLGPLEGHLLGLGQQRLDLAQVEQRVAVVELLHDPGDDVALAVGVLLELAVPLDLADALGQHLAEGLGGDAAHVVGRVVAPVDQLAELVDVVRVDADVHRLGVDLDLGLVGGIGTALVGRDQGIGQDLEQGVDRDAAVGGQHPDRVDHVDVGHAVPLLRRAQGCAGRRVPCPAWAGLPRRRWCGLVRCRRRAAAPRRLPSGSTVTAASSASTTIPPAGARRRRRGGGGC